MNLPMASTHLSKISMRHVNCIQRRAEFHVQMADDIVKDTMNRDGDARIDGQEELSIHNRRACRAIVSHNNIQGEWIMTDHPASVAA